MFLIFFAQASRRAIDRVPTSEKVNTVQLHNSRGVGSSAEFQPPMIACSAVELPYGTVLFITLFWLLSALLYAINGSRAEDSFFHAQVVPILQRRCVGCHNDSDGKGDFSIESAEGGSLSSGFIEPGDIERSRLIEVITPVDGKAEMPKDADPMTAKEIAILAEMDRTRSQVADGCRRFRGGCYGL